MTWPSIRLWSLWILALNAALQARSQTVELASSQLTVLTGLERDGFLSAHNAARKEVAVDPVEWSDNLASHAHASLAQQKDALIAAAKESWTQRKAVLPRHSADRTYGQNVAGWVASASGTSEPATKPPAADWAVTLWLQEKADFDKLNAITPYRVGDEKDQPDEKHRSEADPDETKPPIIVGHYTQIVWSATRQIGAAKLVFDLTDDQGNHRTYTANLCNYNPPGNRQGQKPF